MCIQTPTFRIAAVERDPHANTRQRQKPKCGQSWASVSEAIIWWDWNIIQYLFDTKNVRRRYLSRIYSKHEKFSSKLQTSIEVTAYIKFHYVEYNYDHDYV